MMTDTDTTVYHLIVDRIGDKRIFVFFDHEPALEESGGPIAEPVSLELMPSRLRYEGPVGLLARPILGRDPDIQSRFREFRSEDELLESYFIPIPYYRVCNRWEDYHNPWLPPVAEGETKSSEDGNSPSTI